MYVLDIEIEVVRAFKKLAKKDHKQMEIINKKVKQIQENPHQFKPLRHPLEGQRRVHIGSFVMIYEIVENSGVVRILKYNHHDEAYG